MKKVFAALLVSGLLASGSGDVWAQIYGVGPEANNPRSRKWRGKQKVNLRTPSRTVLGRPGEIMADPVKPRSADTVKQPKRAPVKSTKTGTSPSRFKRQLR
jgi:hypothetical protein